MTRWRATPRLSAETFLFFFSWFFMALEGISRRFSAEELRKHLPSLLQRTSLAFLRSEGAPADVVKFLQQRAGQLNSRVLSAAAARAGADPMAKAGAKLFGGF